MKTSCDIIQDLLPLYCDGVCSDASKQTIEKHLQECDLCKEEFSLLQEDITGTLLQAKDKEIAKAAASAWKKGKKNAFIKGCLIVLVSIVMLVGTYIGFHWVTTVDESNYDGLAQQAADYLGYGKLFVEEVEQRGDYLAVLCKDMDDNWCMCVFDRDGLFKERWCATGGKPLLKTGSIGSWNYGSPNKEAVLIFCGGDIPEEVCWYKFQNSNITYTCPVEDRNLLDIFIIPDRNDINGHPILLDINQQEIE